MPFAQPPRIALPALSKRQVGAACMLTADCSGHLTMSCQEDCLENLVHVYVSPPLPRIEIIIWLAVQRTRSN
jgi:hypothetical protein